VLFKILRLLHPFMPFITEELAHQMGFLNDGQTIMYEAFPQPLAEKNILCIVEKNTELMNMVDGKFQLIRSGRALKVNYNIPAGKKASYYIKAFGPENEAFLKSEMESVRFLLNADEVIIAQNDFDAADGAAPSEMSNIGMIYLPLKGLIDIEAELKKLNEQKKQLEGWIKGSEAKLSNKSFVDKAPENVVREAQAHCEDLKQKLVRVNDLIASLN
jgi:valyl-tRNA synthetase